VGRRHDGRAHGRGRLGRPGSGSVNRIDSDTTAIVRDSTVTTHGSVLVSARNESEIIAGAGAVAISLGVSGKSTAAAIAIGGAFAINFLRGDTNIAGEMAANQTLAAIDNSTVTADGSITVAAESRARIFALGIGAAGSVASSTGGQALAFTLAGSIGFNEIQSETVARVMDSTLTTAPRAARSRSRRSTTRRSPRRRVRSRSLSRSARGRLLRRRSASR
jgi:hypothetical protein